MALAKDIIKGWEAIQEAFGFPLYDYHREELRRTKVVFKKLFGCGRNRRMMVYTYRALIYMFQREGGFQRK